MFTYHRKALIKNMNLEFGELMTRINQKINYFLKESSLVNFENIENWDLNCEEDIKCLAHIEKIKHNISIVSNYIDAKMRYKKMEHEALFTKEFSEENILKLAEEFSLNCIDESLSKDIE